MDWVNFIWPLTVVALTGWVLGLLGVWLYLARGWRSDMTPAIRERRLAWLAALPWVLSVLLVVAVNSVSLVDSIHRGGSHCSSHSHGHLHACSSNEYLLASGSVELTVAGGLLLLLLFSWGRIAAREWGLRKKVTILSDLSYGNRKLRVLEGAAPLALAVGMRHSFVLLSRGLLDQLSFRQRRVVLAHEVAHLRSRDTVRNVMFEVMLAVHPFWQAKKLRQHWRQALEERADDSAVAQFGREAVADTLIRVARVSKMNHSAMFSMSGAGTIQRIERLLRPAETQQKVSPWVKTLHFSFLVGVAIVGFYFHHEMEAFASWLMGGRM